MNKNKIMPVIVAVTIGTVFAVNGVAEETPKKTETKKTETKKTQPPAHAGVYHKSPTKMTCEEFLTLGDEIKPRVIYWLDGYNKKGRLNEAELGVISFERPVAVIIDACKKTPKESLWQKIKQLF